MINTAIRIGITLAGAGLGLFTAGAAIADACDTRADDVEYLDPPYTAQELRAAMPAGLEVVMRTESPVAGNFSRHLVVEQVSDETVRMRETTLEEELQGAMPPSTVDATWAELRDHACFPAENTRRSRITARTPFGELAAWRYQFDQEPVRLVLTFADELPGLPVTYERFESGILVLSSHQAQRSDRLLVDESEDLDEAEPDSAPTTTR